MKDYRENFTVLFLKENFAPFAFRFSRKALRKWTFLSITLVLSVLLLASLTIGLALRKGGATAHVTSSLTAEIEKLRAEKTALEIRLSDLGRTREVKKGDDQESNRLAALYGSTVKIPTPGSTRRISLTNYAWAEDKKQNHTTLTFNINNDLQDGTISGFINVIALNNETIKTYPPLLQSADLTPLLSYNSGETFQVSRFRQVVATFDNHPLSEIQEFQIYIFSSDGILLNRETVNPHAKSGGGT